MTFKLYKFESIVLNVFLFNLEESEFYLVHCLQELSNKKLEVKVQNFDWYFKESGWI